MADSNSTTTDNGGGNGLTIIVGLVALALVGGFGYWYFNKKDDKQVAPAPATGDNPASNTEKNPVVKEGADTKAHTVESATNSATKKANTPATGDGMSPLRANHDAKWNYQKRNGVWYTAKKDGSVQWVSLAKNKTATDTLNAAYPND